jgi:hypothetical protein
MLSYWLATQHLVWNAHAESEKLLINLESLDDPATGPRLPKADELAGLCFYSPKPKGTIICLNGKEMESVVNKPDHTGMSSIGLPPAPPPGTDLLEG